MKNLLYAFCLTLIITGAILSQPEQLGRLWKSYSKYHSESVSTQRFSVEKILSVVRSLSGNELYEVEKAGSSIEGSDIYLVHAGKGKTNVLLWSQMHGDEPTATMALLDLFNFLADDDEYNDLRGQLLNNLSLYFIPLLNPDGAQKFQRRNAIDIDLNRDALRLQSPEAKILKSVRDSLDAPFGFNLHDQSSRYTSGNTWKSASLSFLAPAFNRELDMNIVRERGMQVIAGMDHILKEIIPGHTGRYDDEFEPRAFGDNFVKWGTSSILIESGGWKDDTEKQFIRKLNFISLVGGLSLIASEEYKNYQVTDYLSIPENEEYLFDLLLRNVTKIYKGNKYIIDLGINRREKNCEDYSRGYYESEVSDLGDLSTYYGYEELDCAGLVMEPAKIFEGPPEKFAASPDEFYKNGYATVLVKQVKEKENFTLYPFNITGNKEFSHNPAYKSDANFILKQNDQIRFIIINGYLVDVSGGRGKVGNGMIFK